MSLKTHVQRLSWAFILVLPETSSCTGGDALCTPRDKTLSHTHLHDNPSNSARGHFPLTPKCGPRSGAEWKVRNLMATKQISEQISHFVSVRSTTETGHYPCKKILQIFSKSNTTEGKLNWNHTLQNCWQKHYDNYLCAVNIFSPCLTEPSAPQG